jgi:glycosyltransferase involved in cell wall biosynthesis
MNEKGKPTASWILLAYNQEQFIGEALEATFAQTYSPLEIILCDDCSQDRTFDIMRKYADAYDGPHKIVLFQNEKNLGLTGNLNRGLQHATGDVIIAAAGDDVSLPERAAKLVKRLTDSESPVDLAVSYFEEIDVASKPTGFVKTNVRFVPEIGQDVMTWRCGATGACAAYRRKLYDKYGPVDSNVISEDWVFAFRAWLERGIALLEEPLVKHRMHVDALSVKVRNVSKLEDRSSRYIQRRRNQASSLAIAEEWLKAWTIAKDGQDVEVRRGLERLVSLRRAQLEAFGASPSAVIRSARTVLHLGGPVLALKLFGRHLARVY